MSIIPIIPIGINIYPLQESADFLRFVSSPTKCKICSCSLWENIGLIGLIDIIRRYPYISTHYAIFILCISEE